MLLEMIYRSLIDTKPNDIISELKMWEMAENTVSGTTIAGLSLKIANKGGRQVCISPFSPLPDRSIVEMQLSQFLPPTRYFYFQTLACSRNGIHLPQ